MIYVVLGNVALSETRTILSLAIRLILGVNCDVRGCLASNCAATERDQFNRKALEVNADKKESTANDIRSVFQDK